MTFSPTNHYPRAKRTGGFTIVEVMIAAGLGSIIMAGVLATFLFLIKTGVRTNNYATMEAETRLAFEQLGIDARMAGAITSNFTSGVITSITMTIRDSTHEADPKVTYVYDTSDPTNKKLVLVPGNNPAATVGRRTLVNKLNSLTFLRYDSANVLIPASTASDVGVKHIQISCNISRTGSGVAIASQIIRSSAFTLRNL